jgi:Cupin-like domain
MRTVTGVKSIEPRDLTASLVREIVDGYEPVRLVGLARNWPAYAKWSLSRIEQDLGEIEIKLEVGNVLQGATAFETCRLKDYLAVLATSQSYTMDSLPPLRDQKSRYLSLFSLSKHAAWMLDDIDCGFFEADRTDVVKLAWIGPSLTVSGWHYDWKDNLFSQVCGRKVFHLVAPDYSARMYPSRKYDPYSTLSRISHDPFRDDFDHAAFPDFDCVPLLRADLAAGDALYLPRHYWHHVTALTPSISVSVFGSKPLQGAVTYMREKARAGLFRFGWRREDNTLVGSDA